MATIAQYTTQLKAEQGSTCRLRFAVHCQWCSNVPISLAFPFALCHAGRLRRSLGEKEAQLKKKERELSDLRTRLERLTGDLGNTHSKHTEHSSKLEQNLLNCQGELLVAQNRWGRPLIFAISQTVVTRHAPGTSSQQLCSASQKMLLREQAPEVCCSFSCCLPLRIHAAG